MVRRGGLHGRPEPGSDFRRSPLVPFVGADAHIGPPAAGCKAVCRPHCPPSLPHARFAAGSRHPHRAVGAFGGVQAARGLGTDARCSPLRRSEPGNPGGDRPLGPGGVLSGSVNREQGKSKPPNAIAFGGFGAGYGSRTRLCSLGSCHSTDELIPHSFYILSSPHRKCNRFLSRSGENTFPQPSPGLGAVPQASRRGGVVQQSLQKLTRWTNPRPRATLGGNV